MRALRVYGYFYSHSQPVLSKAPKNNINRRVISKNFSFLDRLNCSSLIVTTQKAYLTWFFSEAPTNHTTQQEVYLVDDKDVSRT